MVIMVCCSDRTCYRGNDFGYSGITSYTHLQRRSSQQRFETMIRSSLFPGGNCQFSTAKQGLSPSGFYSPGRGFVQTTRYLLASLYETKQSPISRIAGTRGQQFLCSFLFYHIHHREDRSLTFCFLHILCASRSAA